MSRKPKIALVENAPCDRRPDFLDMEGLVNKLEYFATALALAIEGMGRLALNPEEEHRGIEGIASEAMYTAIKVRQLWYELHEQIVSERRGVAS
jgi:hypothetical protein